MQNKRSSQQIEYMKETFSDPVIIKSFLSHDELEELKTLKDTCKKKQIKTNGTHIVYNDNWREEEQRLLKRKIEDLIGTFDVHGGNYFETRVPFFPHVDNGKGDWVPYKNILIPLLTTHPKQGLVFFKQRWPHYSATFYKKGFGIKMAFNESVVDYDDIINLDYNSTIDIDDVQHIDNQDLAGLSIDTVIYYNPGDLIIFDTAQIHAGTFFPKGYIKHGWAIFTHRKL